MSRLMPLALLAGLAGLALADDPAATPAKLPRFKDYVEFPDRPVGKVKAVEDDTVTVLLPEITVRQTSRRRPPTVKGKLVEYTVTLHPEALVRWAKLPDNRDDKGRLKPLAAAELRRLKSPPGAPGYLGDRKDVLPGQTVELTLLVPVRKASEELQPDDLRVKFVVIQGSPTDPKPREGKKDEKKEKQ